MYVPTHVRTYVRMYVCRHACMYVCMHVCMFECTYAYGCMYVCINVCMYVCMYLLLTSRKAYIITESMLCRQISSAYKALYPLFFIACHLISINDLARSVKRTGY